ncbi:MAG: hypothetical protein JWN01_174 [Patescibacteria group bacterium]|nr:hypothetical protein [Patescibacteria group bacterium]
MDQDNPHSDLIKQAEELAQKAEANHSGDRYSAGSASKIIASNGRLDVQLRDLIATTKANTISSDRYNVTLIKLTKALVALTIILVVATVVLIFKG